MNEEDTGRVKPFFNRSQLDKSKSRPNPISYKIYLCCKYAQSITDDTKDSGAWCALICRDRQDKIPQFLANSISNRSTSMLSGVEINKSHVEIRLSSIMECLEWVVNKIEEQYQQYLDIFIYTNDVYIANLVKEWIPKWEKDNNINERPFAEYISKLSAILKRVKLNIEWMSEKNIEFSSVREKVEEKMKT